MELVSGDSNIFVIRISVILFINNVSNSEFGNIFRDTVFSL